VDTDPAIRSRIASSEISGHFSGREVFQPAVTRLQKKHRLPREASLAAITDLQIRRIRRLARLN
jgi:S-adenosylmethionine hydrolase